MLLAANHMDGAHEGDLHCGSGGGGVGGGCRAAEEEPCALFEFVEYF